MYDEESHPARDAIRLLKTKEKSKSKLGGKPNLPSDIRWPVNKKGRELDFLAQIHCPDLPKNMGLPEEGTLFFFYDIDMQPWGIDQDKERYYWRVIYYPGEFQEACRENPRKGHYFVSKECFLTFKVFKSHFDWGEDVEDDECSHQMLGYPSWIQCEDMAPGKVLLLQLDSDQGDDYSPGWMWGDVGIVYFWISPQDLAKKNFDNVELYLECC